MTFGIDDFLTTRVGGESEYESSDEDVGRGLLELLRVLIRRNASGGELLVIYCNRGYMFYTMRKGLSEG
jgi:hypothetical protein